MGRFSYALWMVEVTVLFVTLGLPNALTRYLSHYQGQGNSTAQAQLVHGGAIAYVGITAVACAAVYFLVSRVLFVDLDQGLGSALALLVATQLWAGLSQAVLTGLQDFKTLATLTIISTLISVVGQSVGAALWGVQGAVFGTAAAFTIPALAFVMVVKRRFKDSTRKSNAASSARPERDFYLYAANSWLAALISAVTWGRAELFFIERFSRPAELGFFAIGLLWSGVVIQTVGLMSAALMPHFSSLAGSRDLLRLKSDYRRLSVLAALVAFPLSAGGAALMPELIRLIFGDAYVGGLASARIMIATGLWSFATVGSAAVYGLGEAALIMRWSVLGATLTVLGCLLLVPEHGATGAATVRFLVQGTMVGIGAYLLRSRYGLPFPARTLGAIAGAAFACALTARVVASFVSEAPLVALVLAVATGGGVYVVALRVLRILTPEDAAVLHALAGHLPSPLAAWLKRRISWVANA